MPRPYTSIAFRSGSSCLEIELAQTLTPEAFETVLARTGEKFSATFGLGTNEVEEDVTMAGLTNEED